MPNNPRLHVFRVAPMLRQRFPIDMLRHDACWPRSSDDALKVAAMLAAELPAKCGEIQLVSHDEPTAARWLSFGWRVIG
jgi:hypothetical protein